MHKQVRSVGPDKDKSTAWIIIIRAAERVEPNGLSRKINVGRASALSGQVAYGCDAKKHDEQKPERSVSHARSVIPKAVQCEAYLFFAVDLAQGARPLWDKPAVAAGLEEKPWNLEQVVENDRRLHAAERGREERRLRETGMLIILAWMSVTIAALLTVGLLPVAVPKIRRSPEFALMTLAMLGMLWRGEAWKTVYLAEEARLSQERQLSPKTTSMRQGASIGNGDLLPTDGPLIFAAVHVQWPQHYTPCEREAYLEIPQAVRPCILESCSGLAESSVEHDYDNLRLSSVSANRHQHQPILYDI